MDESAPALWRRAQTRIRKRWRAWLRAMHRDAGYLAIGLTFVYALSGLALNHIGDWDPNTSVEHTVQHVEGPFSQDEEEAGRQALERMDIDVAPNEVFYATDTELEIGLPDRLIIVHTGAGFAFTQTDQPRFFLRVANYLHVLRGKKAWTYIADGYAIFLLFLAVSGLFMLKGKKGFVGRGAILVSVGVGVPVAYVILAGGP